MREEEEKKKRRHKRGEKEIENKGKKNDGEGRKGQLDSSSLTRTLLNKGKLKFPRGEGKVGNPGILVLSAELAYFFKCCLCSWSSGFLFSFKELLIEEISSLSGRRNQVNQIRSFSIYCTY